MARRPWGRHRRAVGGWLSRSCRRERRFRYPGGRPRPDRECLQGILYVLHSGIPLAPAAGGTQTCGIYAVYETPLFTADLTVGADGALWFTLWPGQPRLGRMSTSGALTWVGTPGVTAEGGLTASADRLLWFSCARRNLQAICRLDPVTHALAVFRRPAVEADQTWRLTAAPQGGVWFEQPALDADREHLFRMSTAGAVTEFPTPPRILGIAQRGRDAVRVDLGCPARSVRGCRARSSWRPTWAAGCSAGSVWPATGSPPARVARSTSRYGAQPLGASMSEVSSKCWSVRAGSSPGPRSLNLYRPDGPQGPQPLGRGRRDCPPGARSRSGRVIRSPWLRWPEWAEMGPGCALGSTSGARSGSQPQRVYARGEVSKPARPATAAFEPLAARGGTLDESSLIGKVEGAGSPSVRAL